MSQPQMDINNCKVQGIIAAIVRAADSGYLSAIRLELKNHEGIVTPLTTDTSMMRSHNDPSPLSERDAADLIADAGLYINTPKPEVTH
jgi:hypothetical protein